MGGPQSASCIGPPKKLETAPRTCITHVRLKWCAQSNQCVILYHLNFSFAPLIITMATRGRHSHNVHMGRAKAIAKNERVLMRTVSPSVCVFEWISKFTRTFSSLCWFPSLSPSSHLGSSHLWRGFMKSRDKCNFSLKLKHVRLA